MSQTPLINPKLRCRVVFRRTKWMFFALGTSFVVAGIFQINGLALIGAGVLFGCSITLASFSLTGTR